MKKQLGGEYDEKDAEWLVKIGMKKDKGLGREDLDTLSKINENTFYLKHFRICRIRAFLGSIGGREAFVLSNKWLKPYKA